MKLLALGLAFDSTDVGETYSAFKWVEALSEEMDVTLLCMERRGRTPTAEQLPNARVIAWPEPALLDRFDRIRALLKPNWLMFAHHAERWIRDALDRGERFDIAHQIVPQAMRHRSPLRKFDIPYAIGPLGGSLPNPPAFQPEMGAGPMMTRLRAFDRLRFRHDQGLRRSYEQAGAVLGVAPYVRDILGDLDLQRFEPVLERSSDELAPRVDRGGRVGELKLLHVGRVVRSKGLRDMIRAMALIPDLEGVTLTSAGEGEDLAACRQEAERLGVAARVHFLGKVSRDHVEKLYGSHDVFAFPSFREPMGGVFFEAMRWGLPIISANRGGPAFIVDDASGFRVEVDTPERFAQDIAAAIRALALDPVLRDRMGEAARQRLLSFGSWPDKARQMGALYREVIAERQSRLAR